MEFPKRDVVQIPPVTTPGVVDAPNAPYGYAPDQFNNAAAPPPTYKDDSNDHCNILPPAPRSQIYPPKCGNLKPPFKKGGLYITYSPAQGTAGFTQGAPDNAKWVRGNEFGDNYKENLRFSNRNGDLLTMGHQDKLANAHLHSKEINVGKVLQSNPLYVADSPFYKRGPPGCSTCSAYEQQQCAGDCGCKRSNMGSDSSVPCTPDSQPTSCTRKDRWNLTYPHLAEYTNSGQPIFYSDPAQQPTFYIGEAKNGVKVIEGFNPIDFDSGSTQMMVIIWAVALIAVFMLMVTLRKRN
jgi:hypothetical protein